MKNEDIRHRRERQEQIAAEQKALNDKKRSLLLEKKDLERLDMSERREARKLERSRGSDSDSSVGPTSGSKERGGRRLRGSLLRPKKRRKRIKLLKPWLRYPRLSRETKFRIRLPPLRRRYRFLLLVRRTLKHWRARMGSL